MCIANISRVKAYTRPFSVIWFCRGITGFFHSVEVVENMAFDLEISGILRWAVKNKNKQQWDHVLCDSIFLEITFFNQVFKRSISRWEITESKPKFPITCFPSTFLEVRFLEILQPPALTWSVGWKINFPTSIIQFSIFRSTWMQKRFISLLSTLKVWDSLSLDLWPKTVWFIVVK